MSLLLLEGDLLVGLTVGATVSSSWKIVKRPGLLLRRACEVVVELAISGVEEKLAIRKGPIPSWDRLGEEGEPSWRWEILRGIPHLSNVTYLTCKGTREYIFVSACLGYLYTRAYFPCDSHRA